MPQKIAPSAVKAQELAALLQGQTDVSRPGDSPPSGSAGGPAATWTMVERGPHLAYRKSEGWQLSTSSGARRRSIPTFSIFLVLSHVAYYLIARYSCCMHVISRKTLRQFWEQHPDSESALARWFKVMQRHDFTSFETLRGTFPTADKVGDFIVFNIGGNKYRLITAIHFNRRKVYVRHVLTHLEYDRGVWKP